MFTEEVDVRIILARMMASQTFLKLKCEVQLWTLANEQKYI